MAKQAQTPLDWNTVNVDTELPVEVAKAYQSYRKAMEAMLKARNTFEASAFGAMKAANTIPAGHDVAFGYNFGKLAVAWCDLSDPRGFMARNRKATPSKAAPSGLFGKSK